MSFKLNKSDYKSLKCIAEYRMLTVTQIAAIFHDPMTTAAAIDRLVHHSVVLELNVPSYRAEQAGKRRKQDK